MANPTFKAVNLELHPPGGYRKVQSTLDAARALMELWPKQEGAAFDRACMVCTATMDGKASGAEVRAAFIAAAEAAGIMIRRDGY
jgi:hypothetical protein